ncbi:hypothetical protein [Clostridioides difficile]|uniref:hypothetical protein n=1 Tax=Clostridioides difficile TaxID=1496 RepID=UPI0025629EA7|nr:hypothetical protein [Clostridioides difficile]GMK62237.1 hypothetical protein JSCD1_21250 [Clostridioides difficile]
MKIEMGESLLYSWLRHVKECQIVQTNWKVSSKWDLKNADKILEIMEKTKQYFEQKYGYPIYKNNSLEQLIMQAEVDVLGISIDNGRNHIYAIDVAFHEAGLNYGSKNETVTRVIKKCIRTAMCIYGYMDLDEAEIIFASPKINPAIITELEPKMAEVNDLFKSLGLRFKTRLIANEEFNGKILEPILIASDGISDTSELFLRSYQMYSMFSYSRDVVKQQRIKKSNSLKDAVELNLSDETLKELKIGKLVQVTMKHLFEEEKISPEEIDKMTQSSYSKQVFNENKPVLKEVPKDGNINELKKDEKNYNRYYAYTISIYGKQYLLVSQWIEDLPPK